MSKPNIAAAEKKTQITRIIKIMMIMKTIKIRVCFIP